MKNSLLTFAAISSIVIIFFLALINYLTSMSHPWFIYPAFGVVWWPISINYVSKRDFRGFSIMGSILIISLLITTNLITSPGHLWFLYAILPVLWWPIIMFLGRKAFSTGFALFGYISTVGYYVLLNLMFSPQHLWSINLGFVMLWWPLSIHYVIKKRHRNYSILGFILISSYLVILNLIFSPSQLWFLYAVFPILWWPMAVHLGKKAATTGFALISYIIIFLYYLALNIFLTPGYPWIVFLAFAVMWWPATLYFIKRKQTLGFSIFGAISTISLVTFLNIYFTPGVVWAVYPAFAIVWWPLACYYFVYKKQVL